MNVVDIAFQQNNSETLVETSEILVDDSTENLNYLLDLYDDSCEPQFFTVRNFGGNSAEKLGGKFRRNSVIFLGIHVSRFTVGRLR